MNTNFNKIVIVSLCDEFSKNVGKRLSQQLDMIFCDAKDLVEYELIDKDALKQISSKEYLDGAEKKVMSHIASFENVVVAINFDYLSNNFDILSCGSIVVFLRLPRTYVGKFCGSVNEIAYESRTNMLETLANVTLKVQFVDEEKVCNKIINTLGGIL